MYLTLCCSSLRSCTRRRDCLSPSSLPKKLACSGLRHSLNDSFAPGPERDYALRQIDESHSAREQSQTRIDDLAAMALHFLTLPGEIRNRIYEFALTEIKGVHYLEDYHGTGRLCISQVELAGPRTEDEDFCEWGVAEWEEATTQRAPDTVHVHMHNEIKRKREVKDTADLTAVSPVSGVQEELLSKDCVGLGTRNSTFYAYTVPTTYTIANQMQFVCKQLRQETRCHSLRYNKVIFSDRSSKSGVWLCASFLQTLPLRRTQDLIALAIKGEDPCWWDAFDEVLQFCRLTPGVTVNLHQNGQGDTNTFLYTMLYSHRYLREMTLLAKADKTVIQALNDNLGVEHPRMKDCRSLTPRNLRVRHGYDAFDEKSFRDDVLDCEVPSGLLSAFGCSVDDMFNFAKELVEVGF